MASILQARLKAAEPIVRKYVAELEKRNSRLQTEIVKLEADAVERQHRLKALEKEAAKPRPPTLSVNILKADSKVI